MSDTNTPLPLSKAETDTTEDRLANEPTIVYKIQSTKIGGEASRPDGTPSQYGTPPKPQPERSVFGKTMMDLPNMLRPPESERQEEDQEEPWKYIEEYGIPEPSGEHPIDQTQEVDDLLQDAAANTASEDEAAERVAVDRLSHERISAAELAEQNAELARRSRESVQEAQRNRSAAAQALLEARKIRKETIRVHALAAQRKDEADKINEAVDSIILSSRSALEEVQELPRRAAMVRESVGTRHVVKLVIQRERLEGGKTVIIERLSPIDNVLLLQGGNAGGREPVTPTGSFATVKVMDNGNVSITANRDGTICVNDIVCGTADLEKDFIIQHSPKSAETFRVVELTRKRLDSPNFLWRVWQGLKGKRMTNQKTIVGEATPATAHLTPASAPPAPPSAPPPPPGATPTKVPTGAPATPTKSEPASATAAPQLNALDQVSGSRGQKTVDSIRQGSGGKSLMAIFIALILIALMIWGIVYSVGSNNPKPPAKVTTPTAVAKTVETKDEPASERKPDMELTEEEAEAVPAGVEAEEASPEEATTIRIDDKGRSCEAVSEEVVAEHFPGQGTLHDFAYKPTSRTDDGIDHSRGPKIIVPKGNELPLLRETKEGVLHYDLTSIAGIEICYYN